MSDYQAELTATIVPVECRRLINGRFDSLAGRKHVESTYSWPVIAGKTIEVYKQILQGI